MEWKSGSKTRRAQARVKRAARKPSVTMVHQSTNTDPLSARQVALNLAVIGDAGKDEVKSDQKKKPTVMATVRDLSHEDKARIGKLMQRVVSLGKEKLEGERRHAVEVAGLRERVEQYQAQNKDIIDQTVQMKGQFQRAITVIKGFQLAMGTLRADRTRLRNKLRELGRLDDTEDRDAEEEDRVEVENRLVQNIELSISVVAEDSREDASSRDTSSAGNSTTMTADPEVAPTNANPDEEEDEEMMITQALRRIIMQEESAAEAPVMAPVSDAVLQWREDELVPASRTDTHTQNDTEQVTPLARGPQARMADSPDSPDLLRPAVARNGGLLSPDSARFNRLLLIQKGLRVPPAASDVDGSSSSFSSSSAAATASPPCSPGPAASSTPSSPLPAEPETQESPLLSPPPRAHKETVLTSPVFNLEMFNPTASPHSSLEHIDTSADDDTILRHFVELSAKREQQTEQRERIEAHHMDCLDVSEIRDSQDEDWEDVCGPHHSAAASGASGAALGAALGHDASEEQDAGRLDGEELRLVAGLYDTLYGSQQGDDALSESIDSLADLVVDESAEQEKPAVVPPKKQRKVRKKASNKSTRSKRRPLAEVSPSKNNASKRRPSSSSSSSSGAAAPSVTASFAKPRFSRAARRGKADKAEPLDDSMESLIDVLNDSAVGY